jgi:hypothetical protein
VELLIEINVYTNPLTLVEGFVFFSEL